MKISKKADKLLRDSFTKNGRIMGTGVHTDDGTMPLWGALFMAGLVKPIPGYMPHNFSYELTDLGCEYLK